MPRLRYAMFALLAGCATEPKTDTLDPSVGDPSHPGEELPDPPDPTPEGPSPDGDLRVSVNVFNNRCDSPTLAFDVTAWEQDLNTRVPNIECVIEVNDGTKYLGCEGEHTFGGDGGGIGRITATVIDLDSGRTATETASAFVFPAFVPEMQITKPECGLSFTVQGNTSTSAFIALTVS